MEANSPLERLQTIADYRTTSRMLRESGRQSFFWGGLMLLLGYLSFTGAAWNYVYLALGFAEFGVGALNRYRPSAEGIIFDGLLLLVFALWNLGMQALAWLGGGGVSWFGLVVGVFLLLAGFIRVSWYKRARAGFDDPPTEEQLAWLDGLAREILASDPAQNPDTVEFTSGLRWKGKLLGEAVVLVAQNEAEILVVGRDDFEMSATGKTLFGGKHTGQVRAGARRFRQAIFAPPALANYEHWKAGPEEEPTPDAPENEPPLQ